LKHSKISTGYTGERGSLLAASLTLISKLFIVIFPERGGFFMTTSDLEQAGLTIDVGGRLRELRQERRMSMRALARASGLSTNALSMIERAKTSPSVSTLYKIAEALEVPITAFFRVEPERKPLVFCRASERSQVGFNSGLWEGLGGESFSGHVEPFMLSLDPGANSGSFSMLHTGHEFVLCLSGQLEYTVEDQVYLLNQGDSLLFAPQMRHSWRNPGDSITRAVLVLAGFERGERPGEFHFSAGIQKNEG
jgi:transcriptional regulator with XRE-family HTH domain